MRILYLAADPVPAPKGAAVRIARTVATLRELGHEVRLLTPARGGQETSAGSHHHDTVPLPAENALDRMLAFRAAAAEWLAGREADVVWFRGIFEGRAAAERAERCGAKVVFEAHGFPSVELPYHYPAVGGDDRLLTKLIAEENALLAAATRSSVAGLVLTPSLTGRRYLLSRGVPGERIAVVPNCADPSLFSPEASPESGVDPVGGSAPDSSSAASPQPLRLLYQGTLAPWQGLETLLEALALVRGEGFVLELIGPAKSSWRAAIRQRARRLRVHHLVTFSGPVPQSELARRLAEADVAVAPLPADARNAVMGCCPIKLLEAASAARPILSTAIPPVTELFEAGREAELVSAGSAGALAEGLLALRADPVRRAALGAAARERILAAFTPEHFRERLGAAVERLRPRG